ncbi:MAG: anion transporter [Candidatus Omnitrophota bacterium]|jgi:Na+/H+ antiporter NhaD/arsenite permease-like protein|nr:MAG: anion transporter [Candidatus Omnitrophota bacterium]
MTLIVFLFVYLGMFLGEIPGLALDRTGIALLGAIILVGAEVLSPAEAWSAIDISTIALLFGLMIVSAQFRLGGFYVAITRKIAALDVSEEKLLAILLLVAGCLSALLANDIVCLAMTPVLIEGCSKRNLNPLPFLIGLACASNVGSAATLIGNPQNMLIGQTLNLSFKGYLIDAGLPALGGLGIIWLVIRWSVKGCWHVSTVIPEVEAPKFNGWQTSKGIVILTLLLIGFLFTDLPREVLALGAAGILLASRKMSSFHILGLVDWHLLVLFFSLFVINRAMLDSGNLEQLFQMVKQIGLDVSQPVELFSVTVILSNLVSNVPAVMLLLPIAQHPLAGSILAIASTLAGNLLIVGSIANIIVVDKAAQMNIRITWRDHIRIGVPVTLLTLILSGAWLFLLSII